MGRFRQIRDLSIIEIDQGKVLVMSCDSLGAIGAKELDEIKVSGEFVGRALARVALMEVLASGATPLALFNTLAVEMEPSGLEIIRGINKELTLAGLGDSLAVNGSTEENVSTRQTGAGVVVTGLAENNDLLLGKAQKDDAVVAFGFPKAGQEVLQGGPDDPETAHPSLVRYLLRQPGVHELLPVGSKGILFECLELAKSAGLCFVVNPDVTLDLKKSAGPATCILAAVDRERLEELEGRALSVPWQVVGSLV